MTAAIADFRGAVPEDREVSWCPGVHRIDTLGHPAGSGRWARVRPPGIPRPPWTTPVRLREEWVVTTLPALSERWLARIRAGTPEGFSRLGSGSMPETWNPCSQPTGTYGLGVAGLG
jgi:hypothetical protein